MDKTRVKGIVGKAFVVILIAVAVFIFISVKSEASSDKTVLKLAHGQARESEIADTIARLSDVVARDQSMNMEVEIYPSGVLGSEQGTVELVQAGVLDMAKISSNTLGQFEEKYSIFSLPYLFTGQEHYYDAMANSKAIQDLFVSNEEQGYIALGYYANGARNFYLKKDEPVTSPSVLKGLKIRAMSSSTSMDMIELMGGSPVPMAADETYTALQQGVVDGAENTELALTVNKHAEVAKSYTYTEHQYAPDIYIISTKAWNKLSKEQQEYLKEAFVEINSEFVKTYNQMMDEAVAEAEGMGIKVYKDIDKTEFINAVQPLHDDFKKTSAEHKRLYDDIQKYADDTEKK